MAKVKQTSAASHNLGLYSYKGFTYRMDDFGFLVHVTFEELGQASVYIANAHQPQ